MAAKAQLLTLTGKSAEAMEARKRVLELIGAASEARINAFGYELMNEDDLSTALDVFRLNITKFPDSWNAYDSMAEAYAKTGDKKQALINYKIALSKAPDEQKSRIRSIIADMQKG